MPVIGLTSSTFCSGEEVSEAVAARLGYRIVTTADLLRTTSERSGMAADTIARTMRGKRSIVSWFTKGRERAVALFRRVLAETVQEDGLIICGSGVFLLPTDLSHVLRVGLTAPPDHRIERCMSATGADRDAAARQVEEDDEELREFALELRGSAPWVTEHYDAFLPMDKTSVEEAVDIVCRGVGTPALERSNAAIEAARGFLLAADVALALAEEGKDRGVNVAVCGDEAVITINRYVMWLDRFERDLVRIASQVEGVGRVRTTIGPDFKRPEIYPGLEVDTPARILLVDDEVEFVQTLSERLRTRKLESSIAYNGPQALTMAEEDDPEVILLDVKMPGMSGLEVLEKLKQEHPHIQVIMLTAHGSEEGARRAKELGAYAYLRKPANIDELARLMNEACRTARESGKPERDPTDDAPAEAPGEDDR